MYIDTYSKGSKKNILKLTKTENGYFPAFEAFHFTYPILIMRDFAHDLVICIWSPCSKSFVGSRVATILLAAAIIIAVLITPPQFLGAFELYHQGFCLGEGTFLLTWLAISKQMELRFWQLTYIYIYLHHFLQIFFLQSSGGWFRNWEVSTCSGRPIFNTAFSNISSLIRSIFGIPASLAVTISLLLYIFSDTAVYFIYISLHQAGCLEGRFCFAKYLNRAILSFLSASTHYTWLSVNTFYLKLLTWIYI